MQNSTNIIILKHIYEQNECWLDSTGVYSNYSVAGYRRDGLGWDTYVGYTIGQKLQNGTGR